MKKENTNNEELRLEKIVGIDNSGVDEVFKEEQNLRDEEREDIIVAEFSRKTRLNSIKDRFGRVQRTVAQFAVDDKYMWEDLPLSTTEINLIKSTDDKKFEVIILEKKPKDLSKQNYYRLLVRVVEGVESYMPVSYKLSLLLKMHLGK